MRPVNLLPPEQRRGGSAPMRTGALPYVVVGALVLLFVGVVALVLSGNQVSEREDEVATLTQEDARESARAKRLAAYTQFHNLQEERIATVRSLADSRFDWERVMRELALILPEDVWLVEMMATASPTASTGEGGGGESASGLRAGSPGPALEIKGCAVGQDAVARFVTALKDIDGVTRVGVKMSELPGGDTEEAGVDGTKESGAECRTRSYIAKFDLVAVFDAAPPPVEEGAEALTAVAAPPEEASTEEAPEGEEG